MKVGDFVKVKRGDNTGRIGLIVEKRVHDLKYTSFTLFKIEFEPDSYEWINAIYVEKYFKGVKY